MLVEEFDRTRRMLLTVTGPEGAARNPVLARSIRLRNPYVDPMSLIQVELLRRKRAVAPTRRGLRARRDHQRNRRGPAQHGVRFS